MLGEKLSGKRRYSEEDNANNNIDHPYQEPEPQVVEIQVKRRKFFYDNPSTSTFSSTSETTSTNSNTDYFKVLPLHSTRRGICNNLVCPYHEVPFPLSPLKRFDVNHTEFLTDPNSDPTLTQVISLSPDNRGTGPNEYVGSEAYYQHLIVRGYFRLLNTATASSFYPSTPLRFSVFLDLNSPLNAHTSLGYSDFYQAVSGGINSLGFLNPENRARFIPLVDFAVHLDPSHPSSSFDYIIPLNGFKAIWRHLPGGDQSQLVQGYIWLISFQDFPDGSLPPFRTRFVFNTRLVFYSQR